MFHFIIVNFNNAHMTLKHIEQGAFPNNAFLHIVDNSTTEKDYKFLVNGLNSLSDKVGFNFHHYTVENKGFAHANNIIIRKLLKSASDDDIVILLNNDASIMAGAEHLHKLGEFNTVFGALLFEANAALDVHGIQVYGGYDELFPGIYTPIKHVNNNKEFLLDGYVNGAFMGMSIKTLRKIGEMPEEYFLYFEETEWCRRALLNGCNLKCIPSIHVIHEHGGSTKSAGLTRLSLQSFKLRNYFFIRNMIIHFYLRGSPLHLHRYVYIVIRTMILKLGGILLFDDHKIARIRVLLRAVRDGMKRNFDNTITRI